MQFKGIITPMITPVKKGKIDDESTKMLIDFLLKSGNEGIFVATTTGGFTLFSFEEHNKILKIARDNYPNSRIFLSGISRNNLEETLRMGKLAVDYGSDGAVIIMPYYLKFGQDAIFNYYAEIAESLEIPLFVYNYPDLSGNEIYPETLEKLMTQYSNIVGLKDSSGDMIKFNRFMRHMPIHSYIFQGRDDLLYESICLGASGGVCGISNFSTIIHNLYVSKDISYHKKITLLTEKLKNFNNQVSYNYLFRKLVLKEENPLDYAMKPFHDLNEKQVKEVQEVINVINQ
jgi:dihydrodipicolinate synthase/N-acetylneuraminate lyase